MMMSKSIRILIRSVLAILLTIGAGLNLHSQIGVNKTGAAPHPSAELDIASDDSGFLLPRMTWAERSTLPTGPGAEGLLVYQTNTFGPFASGIWQLEAGGSTWKRLNSLEDFRASVIMGAVPTIASGVLPSATLTTLSTGAVRVDIPGLGGSAIVLASPEFLAVGTPPAPPSDYCAASFSGNCATRFHIRDLWITQPVGAVTAGIPPLVFNNFMHHCPTAALCNTGSGDYQFHDINATPPCFPSPDAYNGTFNVGLFVGTNINSVAAGSQFDMFCSGNEGAGGSMALSVYIDWNQDGDFLDSVDGISEQIIRTGMRAWPPGLPTVAPTPTSSSGNTWTVDVPPNAVNGKTTIRTVASNIPFNSFSCINSNNGSTRDYALVISGGAAPVYPGEVRTCNVYNQDNNGFEVRCYKTKTGAPVDDRFYLLINPQ